MSFESVYNIFSLLFIIGTVLVGVWLRYKWGHQHITDPATARGIQRSSILSLSVVVIFLAYWINVFLEGRLIEEGIVGWKVYLFLGFMLVGFASVGMLIWGMVKRFRNRSRK